MGRFLQADPHASGVGVMQDPLWHGDALSAPMPAADLALWSGDGVGTLSAYRGDPVNQGDPMGLFLTLPMDLGFRSSLHASAGLAAGGARAALMGIARSAAGAGAWGVGFTTSGAIVVGMNLPMLAEVFGPAVGAATDPFTRLFTEYFSSSAGSGNLDPSRWNDAFNGLPGGGQPPPAERPVKELTRLSDSQIRELKRRGTDIHDFKDEPSTWNLYRSIDGWLYKVKNNASVGECLWERI